MVCWMASIARMGGKHKNMQLCFHITLHLHGCFYICDQDGGVSPSLGVQSIGLLDGGGEVPPQNVPEISQSAFPPKNGSEVPEVPPPAVPENGSEVPAPDVPQNGSEVPAPAVPPENGLEIPEEPSAEVFWPVEDVVFCDVCV